MESAEAEADLTFLRDLITAVRTAKADLNIAPGTRVSPLVITPEAEVTRRLSNLRPLLKFVGRIDGVEVVEAASEGVVTLVVGGTTFALPLAGLIDLEAERDRLAKERAKAEAGIEKLNKTLENPSFLERAPEAVVAKQRAEREGV